MEPAMIQPGGSKKKTKKSLSRGVGEKPYSRHPLRDGRSRFDRQLDAEQVNASGLDTRSRGECVPDIQLVWPNKNLKLLASGETGYKWAEPYESYHNALKFESLTGHPPKARENVLAIGDGLDVLE